MTSEYSYGSAALGTALTAGLEWDRVTAIPDIRAGWPDRARTGIAASSIQETIYVFQLSGDERSVELAPYIRAIGSRNTTSVAEQAQRRES